VFGHPQIGQFHTPEPLRLLGEVWAARPSQKHVARRLVPLPGREVRDQILLLQFKACDVTADGRRTLLGKPSHQHRHVRLCHHLYDSHADLIVAAKADVAARHQMET
jgi:hypothetical protein